MLLSLPRLHYSDYHRIYYILPLHPYLLIISLILLLVRLIRPLLLLVCRWRRKHHLDIRVSKGGSYLHLFLGPKLGLLHVLLLKNPLLRVAQVDESWVELAVGDVSHLLDLGEGQLVVLVEEEEDNGLVGVHHEGEGL